jgi:hypothetical protein
MNEWILTSMQRYPSANTQVAQLFEEYTSLANSTVITDLQQVNELKYGTIICMSNITYENVHDVIDWCNAHADSDMLLIFAVEYIHAPVIPYIMSIPCTMAMVAVEGQYQYIALKLGE